MGIDSHPYKKPYNRQFYTLPTEINVESGVKPPLILFCYCISSWLRSVVSHLENCWLAFVLHCKVLLSHLSSHLSKTCLSCDLVVLLCICYFKLCLSTNMAASLILHFLRNQCRFFLFNQTPDYHH